MDDASPIPVDLSDLSTERVRLIRHARNRGVCAARNTGAAATRATHLLFLDDDDALLPWAGWFYRRWIAHAPESIVAGAILVEEPRRRPRLRRPPSSRSGEIWGLDGHLLRRGSVHTKQAAAIPKALLEHCGGWDEVLRSRSSSEMFYRLTARCGVAGHPVPVYRLNRGNHEKLTDDPVRRAESHAYIAQKHADLLADPARREAFEAKHEAMMARNAS